eukprot:1630975-Pleurochrysis_carterae.AAC.1
MRKEARTLAKEGDRASERRKHLSWSSMIEVLRGAEERGGSDGKHGMSGKKEACERAERAETGVLR